MSKRISLDDYFMEIANTVSKRSTCIRRNIGAVIVKDKNIIATGFNGAPSNIPHCIDTFCLRDKENIPSGTQHEKCLAVHAEQNAIVQCAKHGHACDGATIYINCQPCILCAKLIINAGIKEVLYINDYPDKESLDLLVEAGLSVYKLEGFECQQNK
jgi:dCMP deaminase